MANTTKSESKSIVAKLVEIAREIETVKPEGRNDHFGYNYITEGQLSALLRGKLTARNLIVLPSVEEIESREYKNAKGNPEQLATVKTSYIIADGDTGEQLALSGAGMGTDSGDKGVYKAVTGAMKYFLMKLFLISDHADPEADMEADRRNAPEKHRATRPYEKEPSKSKGAAASDLVTLRKFLEEEGITEEFVMGLAQEGKLAESEDSLDELKPGTLTRLLTLRKRIKERWLLAERGLDKDRKMEPKKGKPAPKVFTRGKGNGPEDEDQRRERQPIQTDISPAEYLEQEGTTWEKVPIHFGTKKDTLLGDMEPEDVLWWANNVTLKPYKGKFKEADYLLDAALCVAQSELVGGE